MVANGNCLYESVYAGAIRRCGLRSFTEEFSANSIRKRCRDFFLNPDNWYRKLCDLHTVCIMEYIMSWWYECNEEDDIAIKREIIGLTMADTKLVENITNDNNYILSKEDIVQSYGTYVGYFGSWSFELEIMVICNLREINIVTYSRAGGTNKNSTAMTRMYKTPYITGMGMYNDIYLQIVDMAHFNLLIWETYEKELAMAGREPSVESEVEDKEYFLV